MLLRERAREAKEKHEAQQDVYTRFMSWSFSGEFEHTSRSGDWSSREHGGSAWCWDLAPCFPKGAWPGKSRSFVIAPGKQWGDRGAPGESRSDLQSLSVTFCAPALSHLGIASSEATWSSSEFNGIEIAKKLPLNEFYHLRAPAASVLCLWVYKVTEGYLKQCDKQSHHKNTHRCPHTCAVLFPGPYEYVYIFCISYI